ncbi:MAG: 16S rRNA (guanine(966)-N(2))-methyltransferase RsmD [Clostridia bacterium]|nr:16S rRNA (guanine(966)-N(2))-methyltransferase RsmD [Clostridia bacterium]
MRVITGSARGRRLVTPEGMDVRPTVDKVKEGVFSAIQFDIDGRRVLDLFAGSGQLGIEALSRGAETAVFVDNNASSISAVKQNIKACGFEDQAKVINSDAVSYITSTNEVFDIAFIDPPYHKDIIHSLMPKLCERMSDYGIIVCEHAGDEPLSDCYGKFAVQKTYKYGKVFVAVYRAV